MEYQYDFDADCAYILIEDLPHSYSRELDETKFIDYSMDGTVIGIELLFVSGGVDISDMPYKAEISELLKANNIKVMELR